MSEKGLWTVVKSPLAHQMQVHWLLPLPKSMFKLILTVSKFIFLKNLNKLNFFYYDSNSNESNSRACL